jgi:hypothetical protein
VIFLLPEDLGNHTLHPDGFELAPERVSAPSSRYNLELPIYLHIIPKRDASWGQTNPKTDLSPPYFRSRVIFLLPKDLGNHTLHPDGFELAPERESAPSSRYNLE